MAYQCEHHRRKERARMAAIICLFLTVFLVIILVVLYVYVFKPKDPSVAVPMMQIASYSAVGTSPSMVSVKLGLALEVSVNNPNRGVFYTEDSSTASMLYGNTQVGVTSLLPISTPISSQSAYTFGVAIAMPSPISLNLTALDSDPNAVLPMPISTVVTVSGRVTTAGVFSHHSIVVCTCNVNLALSRPHTFIQSYACQRSQPWTGS